ncbi:hypothetical protein [Streptomyces sp. JJ36]|uniref:hypothetical protein n=1 Tax=Streptomyces sp. JJ36 TaxID=2736645 RepID=UPI001F3E6B5B|nr:hypothetical protein [Streptomyces sp. JJ36]MCF6526473.1 hypothetical protein [Streptomyces sp. JJ36]
MPEPPDVARVLRRNHARLLRLLTVRTAVAAALLGTPFVVVRGLGAPDSVLWFLSSPVGMAVLLLTLLRARFAVRLRQCARVLRHYPMEFRPALDRRETGRLLHGTVHTVRPRVPGEQGALWMWAMDAAGPRGRLQGVEQGVWFAGDPPFGGVLVVPGSDVLLFVSPSDWEKVARRREKAGPERLHRAAQAHLDRNHWREPRMVYGT